MCMRKRDRERQKDRDGNRDKVTERNGAAIYLKVLVTKSGVVSVQWYVFSSDINAILTMPSTEYLLKKYFKKKVKEWKDKKRESKKKGKTKGGKWSKMFSNHSDQQECSFVCVSPELEAVLMERM